MPAIKDNPQNPEEFNSIPNGDVTPATEPVKGVICYFSFRANYLKKFLLCLLLVTSIEFTLMEVMRVCVRTLKIIDSFTPHRILYHYGMSLYPIVVNYFIAPRLLLFNVLRDFVV